MTDSAQIKPSNRDLIWLVVLLAFGLTAFHVALAAKGHAVVRAQHMGTAVDYARGHIDLMRPMVDGCNANGVPTPLDFPIWQGITAALMKLFGLWYGWGNIVAIFFLFTSLWPLFDLARKMYSARVAWWTLVFFLLQPLNFIVGGSASGDGAAWAFAVWFVYLAYRLLNTGGWGWWFAAIVAGCLSAVTKAPFFMVAGLTSFFWLLLNHRQSLRAWIQLATVGLVCMVAFVAWSAHGHRYFAQAEFPLINLDVAKGSEVREWYFGTLATRLSAGQWAKFALHVTVSVFGNFALVALVLAATRLRGTLPMWLWLVGAFCSTMVFTPLIFGHEHYLFIFSPAVAALCGCAAAAIEPALWAGLRAGTLLQPVLIGIFALFSLAEGLYLDHINMCFDYYFEQAGREIKEHTAPNERIVVWGAVWGEPFLHAERDGLTGGFGLAASGWINDPVKLARLKELGYTKMVLMNSSPLAVAMTEVSGTHAEKFYDLPKMVPTVARDWPVVYSSPSVLILEIPK